MINIFKSRWFKFVLRTLIDWIVFVLILVIIGSIRSCIEPLDINYDSDYYKRQLIEEMKRYLDITEMRTYIDKKYNAQLFYPAFFDVVDTCGTGSASFNYKLDYSSEVSLKLAVDSNILNRDIEKALDYIIDQSDSSTICLDRGNDYYIVKGNSFLGKSFYRKTFLVNNNWIGYTLSYDEDCEEEIGRLTTLLKDWNPRGKSIIK